MYIVKVKNGGTTQFLECNDLEEVYNLEKEDLEVISYKWEE